MIKMIVALIVFPVVGIVLNGIEQLLNGNSVFELFKYFTILSNLFVGVYFSLVLSGKYQKSVIFNKLFGSVLMSITITFFVFAGYLEWTYVSEGFNKIASLINHYITPILTIGYFLLNKEQYMFEMNDLKVWLLFPMIYLLFLLVYGSFSNDYIYPFFQVDEVGIFGLIISIILLFCLFVLMSFILVKILSKNKTV